MEVFFDHEYIPLIDLVSYGHDIETSWLIDRGCDVIRLIDAEIGTISSEDYVLLKKMEKIARDLSAAIYRTGFDGHSLPEECENGIVKTSRTWWMQAETLVGFLNAYQHDMSRSEYLEAVHSVWDYICEYQVDHREGSEWFHDLYEDGTPFEHQPIVAQWKCPYHNGRMCIEVIRRGVR
jgi:mannobiose 2-epimerase